MGPTRVVANVAVLKLKAHTHDCPTYCCTAFHMRISLRYSVLKVVAVFQHTALISGCDGK